MADRQESVRKMAPDSRSKTSSFSRNFRLNSGLAGSEDRLEKVRGQILNTLKC